MFCSQFKFYLRSLYFWHTIKVHKQDSPNISITQNNPIMQQEHKKWTRSIPGNHRLTTVLNPLRNYIEKQIGTIDLTQFPNRPQKKLDLSIGDPTLSLEFRTHPTNLDIICKNIGRVDGYTNMQGLDEAREAIAEKFSTENYQITKDHVFMQHGGSLAIWMTAQLLANEGDNFLFPSPGFPLLLTIAKSMNITPKFYHLQPDNNWQANLEEMEKLIDEKTQFICVNDPSNPLGSCWSLEHKQDILAICKKHNLPLMADEIYEGVTYDNPVGTFAQVSDGQVTIFKCSGLTKRWFGPGWRMGWLIVYGKEEKIQNYLRGLKNICNIVLMPHTVMQASVKQIINNEHNQPDMKNKLQIMRKNQQMITNTLKQLDYCQQTTASGALYGTIMLKMEKFDTSKIANCIDFCKKLYAEENIMVFPGEFFASELPFVRLTICCNNEKIEEFLDRFKRFCANKIL